MESNRLSKQRWYALQVKPRFEKVVARNLRAKGFEDFLPLYRRRRQWSDRVKEIELPLFPGYVFCQFDIDDRLPVLLIPGVTSIVGFGKAPTPVEDHEVGNLRSILESGVQFQPWPFVSVGQTVSIEHGALEGLEGIVSTVKNEYRLIVSVALLQRSVAVEIDRGWVKPVNRKPVGSTEGKASSGRQLVS
jgi:transcription antitermination factor NusG